jgi:hypothetical protein
MVKVTFSILQDLIIKDLEVIVAAVCSLHASAALTTLGGQVAECCMTYSVRLVVQSSCSLVLLNCATAVFTGVHCLPYPQLRQHVPHFDMITSLVSL